MAPMARWTSATSLVPRAEISTMRRRRSAGSRQRSAGPRSRSSSTAISTLGSTPRASRRACWLAAASSELSHLRHWPRPVLDRRNRRRPKEDDMPRITAIPAVEAGPFLKVFYRLARKRFVAVPEPLAISARHPALVLAGAVHEFMVEKAARTLPVSVRELAV